MLSPNGKNIIVGHFNLKDIDWSNIDVLGYNPGQLFSKFVLENELHQHVFVPTRNTSIFDLVLTDNSDITSYVHVTANFCISDRVSTLFNLNFVENLKYVLVIYISNFKKANWVGMHDMLASINWQMILVNSLDISSCWDHFYDIIQQAIRVFVPVNVSTSLGVQNEGLYQ